MPELEPEKRVAVRDREHERERVIPVDFAEYCRLLTSRTRLERVQARGAVGHSVIDIRSGVRYELRSSGFETVPDASPATGTEVSASAAG